MKTRFTDLAIQQFKPLLRQYYVYDEQVRNFGLCISPGGTKTFIAVTGPANARTRVTLGRYPAMTLKEARKAAARYEPRATKAPIFHEALDPYLKEARRNLRPRSYVEVERHLTKTFANLKRRNLELLSSTAITMELDRLTPSVANHAFAVLKTFLNWCDLHYGVKNPIRARPRPYKETSRDRILSDEELKAIYRASAQFGVFGQVVQFLMFTGQRKNESVNLRHSWIKDGWAHFPGFITKNAHPHSIPLTTITQVIVGLPPPDFCFPGVGDKPYNGWGKHKAQLDALVALPHWTLHDLRRTWSSNAARIGIPPHITERILNHRTSQTETEISRVYNRYDFRIEKHDAMLRMTTHLLTIVQP